MNYFSKQNLLENIFQQVEELMSFIAFWLVHTSKKKTQRNKCADRPHRILYSIKVVSFWSCRKNILKQYFFLA